MELIIDVILLLMASYLIAGVLFSIFFMVRGLIKIDEGVKGSPWHFKLIIWPGVVLLWVVLLKKWIAK